MTINSIRRHRYTPHAERIDALAATYDLRSDREFDEMLTELERIMSGRPSTARKPQ